MKLLNQEQTLSLAAAKSGMDDGAEIPSLGEAAK